MAESLTSFRIPVVDFGAFSIAHKEVPAVTDPAVQRMVKHIYSACSTFGFVYLTNHGIGEREIHNALQTTANFFAFKTEVKAKYKKQDPKLQYGWDEIASQKTSSISKRPAGDLKESLDMSKAGFKDFKFPDDELPELKPTLQSFYSRLEQLSLRVFTALAIGLDVNPEIFLSSHTELHNHTMLRFNFYPQLTNMNIKAGQIRCVEHSDFGSITLLIQDDVGGLEVATQDGRFIPATPIPGTVLVNIADLMQRWTSDRLKSVVHRVIIPEEQSKKEKSRQSIAYFAIPNDETIISCLDGSNKYPPVKSWEYVSDLIEKSYKG